MSSLHIVESSHVHAWGQPGTRIPTTSLPWSTSWRTQKQIRPVSNSDECRLTCHIYIYHNISMLISFVSTYINIVYYSLYIYIYIHILDRHITVTMITKWTTVTTSPIWIMIVFFVVMNGHLPLARVRIKCFCLEIMWHGKVRWQLRVWAAQVALTQAVGPVVRWLMPDPQRTPRQEPSGNSQRSPLGIQLDPFCVFTRCWRWTAVKLWTLSFLYGLWAGMRTESAHREDERTVYKYLFYVTI